MSLSISQAIAASYDAVLAEARRPENQWAEASLFRKLQALGMIKRIDMSRKIQEPLDYQRNPGAGFQATDMEAVSIVKTEVLTAAEFTPGRITSPITWSKDDEAQNPMKNQKVALVKSLLTNGFDTHDDLIEEALFGTSTNGFLGFQTLIADNGEGAPGGINAATETWWKNVVGTYKDDGSDIEAALAEADSAADKGSGSKKGAKLIVTGAEAYGIYEGQLQNNQRYVDTNSASGGFKALAFRQKPVIFSQYGGTRVYGLPPSFKVVVSKSHFRHKGETVEHANQNAYTLKIFSSLQAVIGNRSRAFVLTQVAA